MPIVLGAITVFIQACFIIHVYKTGRPYWWALIILSFPVIGCVVYYFSEIFPGTQEARKAEKLARAIGKKIGGDQAFARRVEEVEICGSVDNKIALAQECMERELYDDAARLYRGCMEGLYADDPNLLLGLATAQTEQQKFNEARATLDRLQTKLPDFKPNESGLLRARTLDGCGRLASRAASLPSVAAALRGARSALPPRFVAEKTGVHRSSARRFERDAGTRAQTSCLARRRAGVAKPGEKKFGIMQK